MKVVGSRNDINSDCNGCRYLLTREYNLMIECAIVGLIAGFLLGLIV